MWWSRKTRQRQRPHAAARPVAEVLEPRILYSADVAAGLLLGVDQADTQTQPAEHRTVGADGEYTQTDTAAAAATSTAQQATGAQSVAVAYAAAALNFEANVGQAAEDVDFLSRGSGYEIALANGGARITLAAGGAQQTVGLNLLGANSGVQADPQGLLAARSNYLLGNDSSSWRTDIANYGSVTYHGVYDGIDVRYYGTQRQLEYDFIVSAGADAGQIRLQFSGVSGASIADNGDLMLALEGSDQVIRFKAPVSWQEGAGGTREAVQSAYVIHADGSIGFALGDYDHSRALVIDPILNYATYFGSSGTESGLGVAVGADGAVYITGRTTASLSSMTDLGGGGAGDIYVAKFSADLSTLIWTTRVGGNADEQGNAIAVDSGGNASVTGWSKSSNFPMVSAAQNARSGSQDAVVFRLNSAGTALTFSTYFGGNGGADSGNAIAVDAAGNVYAAGTVTDGLNLSGLILLGDLLGGLLGGSDDAFITKFNSAGTLQYGSLYGGGSNETATGIAVDAAGNTYIVGTTLSSNLTKVNAADTTYGGSGDAFLAKLSANGGTILYSTYVGSSREDVALAVALDSTGKVYVTGTTSVNGSSNFATTTGAFQTTAVNGTVGFVRVYDLSLSGASTLVYSSFLGGTTNNAVNLPTGIGIDGLGRIVIAGQTSAVTFPVTADALQSTNSGTALFLVIITPNGGGAADLAYGTYYGSGMTAGGLAVNGTQAFLIGSTSTGGLATPGADRTSPAGGADAFVAGFTLYNVAPVLTGANALGTILEDPVSINGTLVSSLISGKVTDANVQALKGIAIIGVDSTNGIWQYTLNGGTSWAAIGTPSAASALLLAADTLTRVRFVPSANFAGTVASGLTLRAWDRTSGTTGTFVDTTSSGGQTAFSSATANAGITVTAVNDAPMQLSGTINNLNLLEDAATASLGLSGLAYGPGGGADETGQTLTYTVTGVPASLGQIVLADGTTVVLAGNSYSLVQLQGMQFKAAANANGGPATFSWSVTDSGGTANGGVNSISQSLSISVTAVNDAPLQTAGTVNNLAVLEDAPATSLGLGGLAYSAGPANEAGQGLTYTVTAVPAAAFGNVVLADGSTVVTSGTGYTLAELRGMQFKAAANANGGPATFSWSITDDGGTANGGANSMSQSLTISVTAVNDAPVQSAGTVNNVVVLEDAPATSLGLGGLAYGTGPANETGQSLTYTVAAVPAATLGNIVLLDGTTIVTSGATYTLTELQGMQFRAAANANGGPATFSWSITDDGGTANSGVNTISQSLTISVMAVNDAPTQTAGAINNLTVPEDAPTTTLGLSGLAYTAGPANESGQSLTYTVTAVPVAALGQVVLLDGTTVVLSGATYTLTELQGMQFKAATNANGGPATFSWTVTDDGGTADGGVNAINQSLTISVTAVNDAPVLATGTISNLTVSEDAPVTGLGLTGLAYAAGPANESGQNLSYAVTAVPPASLGSIVLADGITAVMAGTSYTLTELQGMQFRAAANANGGPATFSWSITDDGGTANGGINTINQGLSISVAAVNDAPAQSAGTVSNLTVAEDAPATSLGLVGLAYSTGPVNEAGQSLMYTVTAVPATALGSIVLADGTTIVTAGTNYTLAALQGMQFKAAANANGGPATFSWAVTDDGGTANGGINSISQSLTISVTAVNDAPVQTTGAITDLTVLEDAAATSLGLSGLGHDAGPANEAGQNLTYTVTAVPAAMLGSIVLADGITVVTAGTIYTLAELQGMQFRAAADANGGPGTFSWSVTDDGGTADGGINTISQSLAISVTAVNDAPTQTAGTISDLVVLEDAAVTSLGLGGLAWSAGPPNEAAQTLLYTVTAVPATALGQILLADGTTVVTAGVTYTLADLQGMQFKAAANASGGPATFSWNILDSGGTANGGVNTLAQGLMISVTGVNDSPTQTAGTITDLTVPEDAPLTSLGLGGLQYVSGNGLDEPGQTLTHTVTAVPGAALGQVVLADGVTVVTAGATYTLTQLQGMQFKAAVNANGGPATFSWTVSDDGGTANGGADTLAQSLAITVTAVNDAPVQTAGSIADLAVIENAPATSLGLGGLSYGPGGGADESGQALSYMVTAVPSALGSIVLADGTTLVTAGATYTLTQLQGMMFVAALNANGGPETFSWSVLDNGGTANGGVDALVQSLDVLITTTNQAPVLAGANLLGAILEDTASNTGTLVTTLVAGQITDGNASAASGIAVTAVDNSNGTWQYSRNGGTTWTAFGAVSDSSATLLSANANTRIRFVPNADWNGSLPGGLSFRAWDRTSGAAGSTVDTTVNGGTTAFSTATASTGITVTAVNDAPVRTGGTIANLTVSEDAVATSLGLGGLVWSPGGGADEAVQNLTYTVTAVPPASLGNVVLLDGTTVVTAGASYTLAELQGMQFKAAANANGGPATFSWSVTDDGGSANGGINTISQSLAISITAVNDAPVQTAGTIGNLVVLEDAAATSLGLGGLAYSTGPVDEAVQTLGYTVTAVPAAALGQVLLADGTTAVTAGGTYTLAELQGMQFRAAANANGGPATFSWSVTDSGGTANGGVNSISQSLTISVTAVNDAPVQTAGAVSNLVVLEDAPATSLGLGSLAYSTGPANEAGQGLTCTVTTVPAAALGNIVLVDGTTVVTSGASYTLAALQGMQFKAAANANGGPATFSWSITDDGGTANSGVNTISQSLTISVTAVNDAPVQTAGAISNLVVLEDAGATSLGLGGLAYSTGPANEAGQSLAYTVTAVPSAVLGTIVLADGTTVVTSGANYTLAALQGMQFKAAANANGGPATFSWSITDDGGTANGGANTISRSLTISVTAVNDAPVQTAGAVNNLVVLEDAPATSLGLGGLAYGTGPANEAAQSLTYTVTAVPAAALGNIVLADGTTVVTSGANYTLAALQGMQFKAAANANGGPATFSWSVTDDGGTANAGVNTISQSLTISVTAVNEAPVQTAGAVNNLSVPEDTPVTSLGLGGLSYSAGPVNEGGQSLTYTVTVVPAATLGSIVLADGTTVVTSGATYSLAALQGMQFKAAANANGGPATFSWSITDDGGTANGAVNTISQSLTISVTAVNDAPVQTAGTINNLTVLEDAPATSLGLGGLVYSTGPANESAQSLTYTVTAVPAAALGSIVLADGTTVVTSGATYSLAALQGMQFKAAANANGGPATFSWSITDDGGTANGGVNTVSQSLSISVAAVNDAPTQTAGTINNLSVLEDAPATSLGLAGLAYSTGPGDESAQNLGYSVTAVPAAALGQVLLADGTTVVSAGSNYSLAQLQGMQFKAGPNANGGPATFSWSITDSGGTANGGANTISQSLTISVTAVNDTPVQTAGVINSLTVLEDAPATSLGLSGLAYSTGPGDESAQNLDYSVTAVPAAALGQVLLADGITVVSAGSNYSLAELRGMQFKAVANANGGPATFSWSITDDGGTANGGVNTISQSLTISVTAVNDAPAQTAGSINNLVVLEDSGGTSLGLGGRNYDTGPANESAQNLSWTVTVVPPAALGQILLADGTTVVTAGASYTLAELRGMLFKAATDASGGPATFSWSVADDGGTASGGVNSISQGLTITVAGVNDVPERVAGAINDLTVLEDSGTTGLGLGGLAYIPGSDPLEAAQLLSFTVTGVPAAALGSIVLADGTTLVTAGASYTLAELQGMQFKVAADANGGAVFSWSVSDDGGTLDGGISTLLQSLNISVTPVNDAPVMTAGTVAGLTVAQDAGAKSLGLAGLAYGPGGGTDEAPQSLTYTVTAVPAPLLGGIVLADGSTPVTAGMAYTLAQLQGMLFKATAGASGGPASFSWTVTDSGGTANGGLDLLGQSMTINVTVAPPAVTPPVIPPVIPPIIPPVEPPTTPVVTPPVITPPPTPEPPAPPPPAPPPVTVAPAPDTSTPAAPGATTPADTGARGNDDVASALDATQQQLGAALGVASLPDFSVAGRSIMAFDAQGVVVPPLSLDRRDLVLGPLAEQEPAQSTADVRIRGAATSADDIQRTLRSQVFTQEMDRMREEVRREFNLDRTVAVSAGAVTFGVSVIYVLWLIRGGVLMGSYLSAMPAWRVLDPLPVLPNAGGTDDEDEDSLDAATEDPGDPLHSLRGY